MGIDPHPLHQIEAMRVVPLHAGIQRQRLAIFPPRFFTIQSNNCPPNPLERSLSRVTRSSM
jgi:hypothetical protein